jgi:phosphoglycolate phosphatase
MLAELNRPPLPDDTVTGMVGEGARILVERALEAAGVEAESTPFALRRFLELYDERLLDHTRPYEGIPELLAKLSRESRLAVLTNKPDRATRRILEGLGLAPFFDFVLSGDLSWPRKPDPAGLLHAMETAGASVEDTLMVGDSRIDLETARAAGVRVCLVSYGFGFEFDADGLEGALVATTPSAIGEIVNGGSASTGSKR